MTPALVAVVLLYGNPVTLPTAENALSSSTDGLTTLETRYTESKSQFQTSKADADKTAYVEATVSYATAVMNSPQLPAREKYPKSLRLYREALATDPQNQTAKDNIAMIEGIYESLGRPIPE